MPIQPVKQSDCLVNPPSPREKPRQRIENAQGRMIGGIGCTIALFSLLIEAAEIRNQTRMQIADNRKGLFPA